MDIPTDEAIEEILSEFAQEHDDIADFLKAARLQPIVDQDRVREDDRIEHVVPMHIKTVNHLVDLLHLALLRDEVAEIQDVDVEKEPLFGLSFLFFHVPPRRNDLA
jgi:hypothetical protein